MHVMHFVPFSGLFSLVFASLAVMWNDLDGVVSGGFFQGYTPVVVILVLIQAFGGLVVAVAVKYADNILKAGCIFMGTTSKGLSYRILKLRGLHTVVT